MLLQSAGTDQADPTAEPQHVIIDALVNFTMDANLTDTLAGPNGADIKVVEPALRNAQDALANLTNATLAENISDKINAH